MDGLFPPVCTAPPPEEATGVSDSDGDASDYMYKYIMVDGVVTVEGGDVGGGAEPDDEIREQDIGRCR